MSESERTWKSGEGGVNAEGFWGTLGGGDATEGMIVGGGVPPNDRIEGWRLGGGVMIAGTGSGFSAKPCEVGENDGEACTGGSTGRDVVENVAGEVTTGAYKRLALCWIDS